MAVPGFQEFMLPLLKLGADGEPFTQKEAVTVLADEMGLSDEDRNELLAGGQTRLFNRVAWARSYLKAAGLLASPSRGVSVITERGRSALSEGPDRIDIKFLDRYPEFVEFRTPKAHAETAVIDDDSTGTPQEQFESRYQSFRDSLASEVLDRVRLVSPAFFERLVVDLLVRMGYGGSREDAGQAIGQSGDGGIDGIIKEDKLGLDTVCIQAKRWQAPVGRPVVQAFAGSLEGRRARKGVLLTTSAFTKDAEDYVGAIEKRIVLIDGTTLSRLMIDHGVGVNEVATYKLAQVDEEYFDEDVGTVAPIEEAARE
jgi:restriction system protein